MYACMHVCMYVCMYNGAPARAHVFLINEIRLMYVYILLILTYILNALKRTGKCSGCMYACMYVCVCVWWNTWLEWPLCMRVVRMTYTTLIKVFHISLYAHVVNNIAQNDCRQLAKLSPYDGPAEVWVTRSQRLAGQILTLIVPWSGALWYCQLLGSSRSHVCEISPSLKPRKPEALLIKSLGSHDFFRYKAAKRTL